MLTFSQIEETRLSQDGKHSLSLQQAAHGVGLPFKQCPECRGCGYTRAILLVTMAEIEVLAQKFPNGTPPVQYDRCERCRGDGGWLANPGVARAPRDV